jgi:hypothetical protein
VAKPPCVSCYYFDWGAEIRKACFHPEDPRYLAAAPAKCKLYVSDDAKALVQTWLTKLTRIEFYGRM